MYIICNRIQDGSLTASPVPRAYALYEEAKTAAERLAKAEVRDNYDFIVLQALSVTRRVVSPVETTLLPLAEPGENSNPL